MMSKIKVIPNENFLVLETPYQLIGIIATNIKLLDNKVNYDPYTSLSLISTFLESISVSNVIRFEQKKTEVFFLVSASSYKELVEQLAETHFQINSYNSKNRATLIFLYNHYNIANSIEMLLNASIEKTKSDPRIIKIGANYWILASLSFLSWENTTTVSQYLQELLAFPQMKLSIHYNFNPNRKRSNGIPHPQISLLLFYSNRQLSKTNAALHQILEVSAHYKKQLSCRIVFHNHKDFKNWKLSFVLGLSKVKMKNCRLDELVDFAKLVNDNGVDIKIVEEQKVVNFPILVEKETLEKIDAISSKESKVTNNKKGRTIKGTSKESSTSRKTKKQRNKPLIPYGKEVSDEEIERLIQTIPHPPL